MSYYTINRTDSRNEPHAKAWRLRKHDRRWSRQDTTWAVIHIATAITVIVTTVGAIIPSRTYTEWHDGLPNFWVRAILSLLVILGIPIATVLIVGFCTHIVETKIFKHTFPDVDVIKESNDLSELSEMKSLLEQDHTRNGN